MPYIRPSLPQSLLDEIDEENSSAHKHKRRQQPSRKAARKKAREGRKQRKAEFFSVTQNTKSEHQGKRGANGEHTESPQRKKAKLEPVQPPVVPLVSNSVGPTGRLGTRPVKQKTALEKLVKRANVPQTKKQQNKISFHVIPRTPQEEEEDAYIAYMERKLGWVKSGKRTQSYGKGDENDGLQDLLNDLDTFEASVLPLPTVDPEGSEMGFESDKETDDRASDNTDENVSEESQYGHEIQGHEEHPEEDVDEEWHGLETTLEVEESSDGVEEGEQVTNEIQYETLTTLPASASAASKYVPPHLRKRLEIENGQLSEAQLKLTKQLKGLLNRMSEQNMVSIVDGIEEIYRNNRRHDVTETLTRLVIDGISSHSMHLDQYVVLHAALVSALHKLVGIEFAAFFVQHVISSYDIYFSSLDDSDRSDAPGQTSFDASANDKPVGKECFNLIVLLSELYNLQVISCVLMYDVIRALLDGDLNEFKVELLLKVARNSGQQLRQDDPTALKSIIQIVRSHLPPDTSALSSRTRFMVETLSNLKNNKVKKAAGQSAGNEAVERMKKFLSGLSKKRHVVSHEPLRVSLEDLRSAETKGKWWLVGAAWGGDPLVEHQQEVQIQEIEMNAPDGNALLKLAKKQGMNTDIRRSIFVVLMSSDDYVDACERLSQLKLTEVRQREIIRVILHCCGNEKRYNPYYALVGQQLCRLSHSHKITLQFCLWDFLRDMGETNVGGAEILRNLSEDAHASFSVKSISSYRIRNVARAFGWWIAKDCCALAILKPVDFSVLKPQTWMFLKELFIHVMANTQLVTPLLSSDRTEDLPDTKNKAPLEDVFNKGSKIQSLAVGLVYFLRETFKGEEGFLKWASQVALQTLRSGATAVPAM